MHRHFINPPALNPPAGFTHVVATTGGKTIHISGQVSVSDRGEVIGKGDFLAQVERTFENLEIALVSAGATFNDVVKVTYFVVDLKPERVPIIREVRRRYFGTNPPASTLVGVAALVVPDWLIEIELVAVVPV